MEKLRRCLKQMLSKVTAECPTDWDKFLPAILFANNEGAHRSTGLSSHEIIFASIIRGPLSLLCDMWVRPDIVEYQTYKIYLAELRRRIFRSCQLARENLAEAGEIQRDYCNRGRYLHTLKPNDEILILLPEKTSMLLTSWHGPFMVVK